MIYAITRAKSSSLYQWLQRETFYRLRLWKKSRAYQRWKREHPGGTYQDYDVASAIARLDAGHAHRTLGPKLSGGVAFAEAGRDSTFERLLDQGLKPEHVCVDYGCGSKERYEQKQLLVDFDMNRKVREEK